MADISISLELNDSQFQGKLNQVKGQINSLQSEASGKDLGGSLFGGFGIAAGVAVAAITAVASAISGLKSAITAGMEIDTLRIRLDALTGSSDKGAAALQLANDAALKLPYSLADISKGMANLVTTAPTLDKLKERIQLTADVAAVAGLPFDQTAEQIQRAMTSGIASADLFRERGVTAMMGFRSGVQYSVEDSKRIIEEYGKANEGVADKLNNTLGGALSQLGDHLTRLKQSFAEAVNPALTAALNQVINGLQESSKAAKDAAFNLGVKFVEAGIAVARVIAMIIDNAVGFYKTFEPIFDFAGKAIKVFADIVVRAIGAVVGVFGTFGIALAKITDAVGITKDLEKAMGNLVENGIGMAAGGLEGFKKQLDEGKLAIFGNAQGVTSARDAVDRYAKTMREAIEVSRKKREEDSKPMPGNTAIGTKPDQTASLEARKQIELLDAKLKAQREEIKLSGEIAGKSELQTKIDEAQVKLANDKTQALASAKFIKDAVDRGYVESNINKLYKAQAEALGKDIPEAYAKVRQSALNLLAVDITRQVKEYGQSLKDSFEIAMAGNEEERRLIENKISIRREEEAQIAKIIDKYGEEKNLTDQIRASRDKEIEQIRNLYGAKKDAQDQDIKNDQKQRDTFVFGWQTSFNKIFEAATTPAKIAEMAVGSLLNNMNSAIDRFVETGKFSFADFAKSVIQDLLKIQLKAAAMNFFKEASSGGGLMGSVAKLFGFADGGEPPIGRASIVGERGPELFIPKSAGTIVPNGGLAMAGGGGDTHIHNYNIQAVDAKSVAQLFAENRMTMFGMVEQARRELPMRTR
jgi:hypothetical protein